jgi:hypothetical protein
MLPVGVYPADVAPAITVIPELKSATVDDCHWYVIPGSPLAAVEVNGAGVKVPQPLWLLPIVPGVITVTVIEAVFTQPEGVIVPVTE